MLVLARELNEVILIGSDIRITVCKIGKGQVRLGIEAPRSVKVMRAEVLDRDGGQEGRTTPEGCR